MSGWLSGVRKRVIKGGFEWCISGGVLRSDSLSLIGVEKIIGSRGILIWFYSLVSLIWFTHLLSVHNNLANKPLPFSHFLVYIIS